MQVQLMRVRQACQLQLARILERRKQMQQGLVDAMPAFIGLRHTSFQHLRVGCCSLTLTLRSCAMPPAELRRFCMRFVSPATHLLG